MSTEGSLFNEIEINEIVEFDGCQIPEEITNNLENHLKEENIRHWHYGQYFRGNNNPKWQGLVKTWRFT